MIDTSKYEGHLAYLDYELWAFTDFMNINATPEERCATDALLNDAPLLLQEVMRLREAMKTEHNLKLWEAAEVKRLGEENDLLRSMQRDGIEASAHDNLLSEINRLREDNEKLHDAINRSFHAKISGSALEIYNGWWEGEEE